MSSSHYLREALEFIKQGENSKAISLLKRYLKEEPSSEEGWLILAHVLEKEELVRKCLNQVLEINPSNKRALGKLAELDATPEEEEGDISPFSTMTFTQEEISDRLAREKSVGEKVEQEPIPETEPEQVEEDEVEPIEDDFPAEEDEFDEEEIPEWLSEEVEKPEADKKRKGNRDRNFYILVSILALIAIIAMGYLILDSLMEINQTPTPIPPVETPVEEALVEAPETPTFTVLDVVSTDRPIFTSTAPIEIEPSATMEPIFTAVTTDIVVDQDPTPYPTIVYNSLAEKWVRPVLAGEFAVGICDSIVEIASTPVAEEDIIGTLLGMGISLGLLEASNAMVRDWIPPDEVAEISRDLEVVITDFIALSAAWLDAQIEPGTLTPGLEDSCEAIKETNTAALAEMEAQGVSFDDVMLAMDTMARTIDSDLVDTITRGFSRQEPFARDEIVVAQEWELEIIEYLRGEDAWEKVDSAAYHNEPAPIGWEYVLLNIRMKSLHAEDEEFIWVSGLDYDLTGSYYWEYNHVSCAWGTGDVSANCMTVAPILDFDVQAMPEHDPSRYWVNVQVPNPRLDADLDPGDETSGWIAFMVRDDETDLILKFDDFSSFDDPPFFALDDGANLSIPESVIDSVPNLVGIDKNEPAATGDVVLSNEWQIEIVDQEKGNDAWEFLHGFSPDDDPAPEGQEYYIFRVALKYLGLESSGLSNYNFLLEDAEGNQFLNEIYSELVPGINQSLFAGGVHEGYLVLTGPIGRDDLVLVFEPWMGFSGGEARYFEVK